MIADHVGVNNAYVSRIAQQLLTSQQLNDRTSTTGRDGKTRNTSNIGKRCETAADDAPANEGSTDPALFS